jgi:hypothetical protein
LQGVWSPEAGGALLCEGQWFIPADLCTYWRVPSYDIPVPATGSASGWRDPVLYPPQPAQRCWVRRFLGNTAAFPTVWSEAAHTRTLTVRDEYTLAIQWVLRLAVEASLACPLEQTRVYSQLLASCGALYRGLPALLN